MEKNDTTGENNELSDAVKLSENQAEDLSYEQVDELRKALPDVELMLRYASAKCIDVDEDAIRVLVGCMHDENTSRWTVEREVQFWLAYKKLAKSIAPVDVGSIKSIHPTFAQKTSLLMRLLSAKDKLTAAQAASTTYKFFGIFVLLLVMILQIYSLIGSSLLSRNLTTETAYDSLEVKIIQLKDTVRERQTEQSLLQKELHNKRIQMEASFSLLYRWHQTWKIIVFPWTIFQESNDEDAYMTGADTHEQKKKKFITLTIRAIFPLKVMNSYLLPLLWGCLGACAYVLRKLAFEIQQMSFNREDSINYNLRIQLGALSGLVIGWFLMPNADNINPQNAVSIYTLSPLALSFLSGYSIELLFSAMDRLIATFTNAPSGNA
jgi:hypothetical protein